MPGMRPRRGTTPAVVQRGPAGRRWGGLAPPDVREPDRGQLALERHDHGPKAFCVKDFEGFWTNGDLVDRGGDTITEPRDVHPPMIGRPAPVRASGHSGHLASGPVASIESGQQRMRPDGDPRVFDSEASVAQLIVGLTPALARALARGERTRDTTRLHDITAQARVELRPQTVRALDPLDTEPDDTTATGPGDMSAEAGRSRVHGVVRRRDGRRRPPGGPRRAAASGPRGDRRIRHTGPGTALAGAHHPPRRIGCHPGSARPPRTPPSPPRRRQRRAPPGLGAPPPSPRPPTAHRSSSSSPTPPPRCGSAPAGSSRAVALTHEPSTASHRAPP